MPLSKVVVVGAGPSGLLLALLLAKAGITVELLEMTTALDTNPRASHYADSSCREFDRAGVLDELRASGFFPNGVSWRKMDAQRTRLVRLGAPKSAEAASQDPAVVDRYHMVCLPLDQLGIILERALRAQPTATLRYGHKVVGFAERDGHIEVDVETPADGQRHTLAADYLVGCDGGNSTVRKLLFGADFPGFTWDRQIVATNMYYDFDAFDYDDSQFFVHPEHWHMVAKIQTDGLHRVTYGVNRVGQTRDELFAAYPDVYRALLPRAAAAPPPTPDQWRLVNFSPYRVHQRCAARMRVGRVLLAADAAHLCNPFGGLGLTGGLADVGSLYDCLVGIHRARADDAILDTYCDVRRRIWRDTINPVSSANMEKLFSIDADEILDKDPVLGMLRKMELGEFTPPPGPVSCFFPFCHDMYTVHANTDRAKLTAYGTT